MAIQLRRKIPKNLRTQHWDLVYSLLHDGSDIKTFYDHVKGLTHSLIFVETETGDVFGGFVSESWKTSTQFYGSGNSFVFKIGIIYMAYRSIRNFACCAVNNEPSIYSWTRINDYFMWSTTEQIGMGGGDNGFAFLLHDDLSRGETNESATYNNPQLCHSSSSFRIVNVEIWGFNHEIRDRNKKELGKRKNLNSKMY
jgi:hypothetical protein